MSAGSFCGEPVSRATIGLIGFAGTEVIEGVETARWLSRFNQARSNDDLATFCGDLGKSLTEVWKRSRLDSNLEILIAGEIAGDVQFWFVRNSQGIRPDGLRPAPTQTFDAQDDLANYLKRDGQPGETTTDLLARHTYSFWQGVLVPSASVFNVYSQLLQALWLGQAPGFSPLASLDDVGQFARVRMEFLKRLCSGKHGIYNPHVPSPIGGVVHVMGVGRDGRVCEYRKHRGQVTTLRTGRV